MTPRARDPKLVTLAALAALAALASCGPGPRALVSPGLGDPCDHPTPCADPMGLVCLEGVCVARIGPPAVAAAEDVVEPIVIDVTAVAPEPDGADGDGDAGPTEDAPTDDDAPAPALVWVGDHTAVELPSGDALILSAGQAPVAELQSPARGRLVAIEVIAQEPPGGMACAVYRPIAWAPEQGVFEASPLWEGAPVVLFGVDGAQVVPVDDGPELGPGPIRVGLVFEQLCPQFARQPVVLLDGSGDLSGTYFWVRGGAGTWVPGAALQLGGRWALRAGLEVSSGR